MLDSTFSISFSTDGVAAATAQQFTKRAHEVSVAQYRKDSVIADPTLGEYKFTLGVAEAKATANFYGTRRFSVNMRHEYDIAVPGGTGKFPLVLKMEGSLPVGVTSNQTESDIQAFIAFLNHALFRRLAKTLET